MRIKYHFGGNAKEGVIEFLNKKGIKYKKVVDEPDEEA